MTEVEFNSIIKPLYKKLYGYAYALLKNEQDASDCLQESVVKLWENRNRLEEIDNAVGYCVITVKRTALDTLRKQGTDITSDEDPPDRPVDDAPPDRQLEGKETLCNVLKLMLLLPETQRKVMELSSVKGMTNSEISDETGLSDENVRVLLSRGRKRLRELYGRSGL